MVIRTGMFAVRAIAGARPCSPQVVNACHSACAAVINPFIVGQVCMVAQMAGARMSLPAALSDG